MIQKVFVSKKFLDKFFWFFALGKSYHGNADGSLTKIPRNFYSYIGIAKIYEKSEKEKNKNLLSYIPGKVSLSFIESKAKKFHATIFTPDEIFSFDLKHNLDQKYDFVLQNFSILVETPW